MNIKPKKGLGQNWLVNPHILDKIVTAAEINNNDIVIEVGPGTGKLTEKIAKKTGTVIAIEKDCRLIENLKEKFKNNLGVRIIESDILEFRPALSKYKIIGNIPYYITSNLIRKIIEEWPKPELVVLTIQKEVAQRIMAKPPRMNLLALSVQYYAEPNIIGFISKNNFRPVPKVDSAIIRLTPRDKRQETKQEIGKLFELIKAGFSEKRKQLAGNLLKHLKIPKEKTVNALAKIDLTSTARAEELSLKQWQELAKIL